MKCTAAGMIAAVVVMTTEAFESYRLRIPNGLKVDGVTAVGHVNKVGGGRPTDFGVDFERAGSKWTKALCEKDSDGDGATNGEELGDPCCTWKVGLPVRANPTSPGHNNKFTAADLAALKCDVDASSAKTSSTDEL
ncbi:Aste57867_1244 [Aphanomyces stellatus]|uniref:Aste57867_1244 protein n=1 Tax=Aphanomyces stellatus TaxID=120398 RepID=A0A485K5Z3_9STRA|nr:hypothetical protein As57867_001243 [Aphanomyces stellatus]VFT78463.1 Aste57867_1244 [Aphanomyces stellatus]